MPDRTPSICRTLVLAAAIIGATGSAASVGRTQQMIGTIGASLTILQPVASQPIRVTGFTVDRDGVARVEMTVPSSARTSQLVMTRVTTSATGFVPEPQPPMLVPRSSADSRVRCHVRVVRDLRAAYTRPLELRVEYLTVAGT